MRSLCAPFAVIAVLAFATGCEDGPNQPFSPAPAGAATVWTAPTSDAAVGPGAQNFEAGYPTTGATTLCSTDFKRQRWAWMLTQPIIPPRFYAGIDLAGGNGWNGLTIGQAEAPPPTPTSDGGGLCQSVPQGAGGTCPSGIGACDGNYWGNNQEVGFSWNVATHILDQMTINLGYTGTVSTGPYPDNTGAVHKYSLAPGDVMRRDGEPYLMDWTGNPYPQINNIFNAMMASYASLGGIAWDTSDCTGDSTCSNGEICQCTHDTMNTTSCVSGTHGKCGDKDCGHDGYCLVYASQWIFGVRPIALYIVGTAGVPQPQLSTPVQFYNFWVKWEPFSYLKQKVELGPNGPTSYGKPTGATSATANCQQQIGQTFGDFASNCVQVHGDKGQPNSVDDVNLNKVLNGLTHDQEHWTANVLGVNQNFTSAKVAQNPSIVVQDTDTPQTGDMAQDWTYDVRARGQTDNDYTPPATTRPVGNYGGAYEFRASSLIIIEWARLMLQDIARMTGKVHTLGDACTGFAANGEPNYLSDPTCSGIEGTIVPGFAQNAPNIYGPGYGTGTGCSATNDTACNRDFSKDPLRPDLNPGSNFDVYFDWWLPIIKPGDYSGAFCVDPQTQSDCDVTVFPQNLASVFQNALNHVIRVMGHGNVHALPTELQDVRYYFKWFGLATVKYLKAYANYKIQYGEAAADSWPDGTVGGGLGPSDVMTQPVDQEELFFDYLFQTGIGQGQTFDKFEYVDRDFIGQGNGGADNWVPWDFEFGDDLLGGNQRYDNWYRRMDREEIAMYSAMLENKSDTPGKENNLNITNLAGSSTLAANWPTWQCATGQYMDPTSAGPCGGKNPPLDPTGMTACGPGGTCAVGQTCVAGAPTYENGGLPPVCGATCSATVACPNPSTQVCVAGGCVNMKMDRNGATPCTTAGVSTCTAAGCTITTPPTPVTCPAPSTVTAHPLLWRYASAWGRSPFGLGHSPITLAQADKQPGIGVAKISIPNFQAGPYTPSPVAPTVGGDGGTSCPATYTLSQNGVWCNAPLNTGTGTSAATFTPLTPWLEVGGGETQNGGPVGFSIPEDGNRDQFVTTGQLDFTGVLESYVVDYVPYYDPVTPSCVGTGSCNPGFACDPNSNTCVTNDNTIRIEAIEGQDFLGQVFMCQDAFTSDILHMGMYDSAASMLAWLAAHPGGTNLNVGGQYPSAQVNCAIVIRTSPYDNAVDRVAALGTGINLNFSGGQGQGRVTDVVVFDPNLIQSF